ncbi:hypothetical protein D9M72_239050 [compost metagenome]
MVRTGRRHPEYQSIGHPGNRGAVRTRRRGRRATRGGGGARRISRMGRQLSAIAARHPRAGGAGTAGAQGGTGAPAFQRRRQDAARRHGRSGARGERIGLHGRRGAAHPRRPSSRPATRKRRRSHARTPGRGGRDRSVEFSDRHPRLEDRAGAGLRQHRGVQARGAGARLGLGAGGHPASRGVAGWRAQSGDGFGQPDRRRAVFAPPGRRDQLHRLGPDRPPYRRRLRGRPAHEAHAARDGRQESTDRPG